MNLSMNSMIANTLFGSKTSISSGSFLSASNFGDLSLMRNGVYTKMLKSYYAKNTDRTDKSGSSTKKDTTSDDYLNSISDKVSKLQTSTSDQVLSGIKSGADKMKKAADAVTGIDFDNASGDAIYSKVKDLVSTYNSLVSQTGKSDLVSISQSRTWMVNDTKAHEAQWNKIGITIGEDQTLSIDEKKLKEASASDIQNFLGDKSGYAARLSTKASGFYQLAANQLTLNAGSSLYNKNGLLG
ncbi:MAG: hypothetical protein ACI4SQ_05740 [Eubacterium sp.]